MEDTVQIRCHRCKGCFREKARRVQNGFSRQCITCETMLFFDEGSADKNVQRTLREARKVRKELREAEFEKLANMPMVASGRDSSSRGSSSSRSTESARED